MGCSTEGLDNPDPKCSAPEGKWPLHMGRITVLPEPDEVQLIGQCVNALKQLDEDGRGRAIRYLADRFNTVT